MGCRALGPGIAPAMLRFLPRLLETLGKSDNAVLKYKSDGAKHRRWTGGRTAVKVKSYAERIAALKTSEQAKILAKNALERGHPELAKLARQRQVELQAMHYGAGSDVERECIEAVYAYEETLFEKHGKKTRAGRTWPMIKERGIIPAVEQLVTQEHESPGFTGLAEMGLQKYAFEAVVLRYPDKFSAEAVARSRERLGADWKTK
jgi:hypothetical protein